MLTPTRFQLPVFLLLLGVATVPTSIPTTFGAGTKIGLELQRKIDSAPAGSTWNIILLFKEDPNLIPSSPYPNTTEEESQTSAYNVMLKLQKFAGETQSSVISEINGFISTRSSSGPKNLAIKSRWCANSVSVSSADKDLINFLGGDVNHENITEIVEDVVWEQGEGETQGEIEEFPPEEQSNKYSLYERAWGLQQINAKAWWDAGFNGSGVIVGHVDDGVDVTHPSLKWNWVGKGDGWRAPGDLQSVFPYEAEQPSTHGTHTLGTIIGRGKRKKGTYGRLKESDVDFFGVGVAPGARWISCMNCQNTICEKKNDKTGKIDKPECNMGYYLDCLEFLYCPNPKNRCMYRPNVISISKGCIKTLTYNCTSKIEDPCIRLLRSVRVILVYGAGNSGREGCETIYAPADSEEVITVGNIGRKGVLALTSSMGPPVWRYNETEINARAIYKPDLVAPGEDILSTIYSGLEGEFRYRWMSGTSMAAPHVAGAIALLLSRTKDLTFNDVRGILRNAAVKKTQLSSPYPLLQCPRGKPDTSLPNHKFGFGSLRLPDPNSPLLRNFNVTRPTRKMPPPPDFTSDVAPCSVSPGILRVALITLIGFLMNELVEI